MKIFILLGLAVPGSTFAQASQAPASSPPGPCREGQAAPAALPGPPAEARRTERLPDITPAPAWVEAMVAPEYGANGPTAGDDRPASPPKDHLDDGAEADVEDRRPAEPR